MAFGMLGCYGSTQPATKIGLDRATLNGQGTTDHGPAHVYFQFWPTAQPQKVVTTPGHDVPGGVTGPVSEATPSYAEPVGGVLDYGTNYSFRLCGQDQGAAQPVCAQTLTFNTARPTGDVVKGSFSERVGAYVGSVDAHSSPSGASPGGTLSLPASTSPGGAGIFSGAVSCLDVHGSRGAVGAVGTQDGHPASALFAIEAAGGGQAKIFFSVSAGSTAPNCAAADFSQLSSPLGVSALRVYDAP